MRFVWLLALGSIVYPADWAGAAEIYTTSEVAGKPTDRSITDGVYPLGRFNSPIAVASMGYPELLVLDQSGESVRFVNSSRGVALFAGNNSTTGVDDGVGDVARFNGPEGMVGGGAGVAYVADTLNHTIRKVVRREFPGTLPGDPVIVRGEVTTIAGANGQAGLVNDIGIDARFSGPTAMAINDAGTAMYICDTGNNVIRKLNLITGEVKLHPERTDGQPVTFVGPRGIAVNSKEEVFVAETGTHVIKKIVGTTVTVFAGKLNTSGHKDDTGAKSMFSSPNGIAVDLAGNLYVCDTGNYVIRKITSTGKVTTIAGVVGSPGSAVGDAPYAKFRSPKGICLEQALPQAILAVADTGSGTITRIKLKAALPVITAQPIGLTLEAGQTATFKVTATGGAATRYQWKHNGVDIDGATSATLILPNVQAADEGAYTVRVSNDAGVTPNTYAVPLVIKKQTSWLWISRPGGAAHESIQGLALSGSNLWAAGLSGGHALRKLSPVTALATSTVALSAVGDGAHAVSIAPDGKLYAAMDENLKIGKPGLLSRRSSTGAKLWSQQMGRRLADVNNPADGDVLDVASTATSFPVSVGTYRGRADFPPAIGGTSFKIGSDTHERPRAFVCKSDTATGRTLWLRDVFSNANSGKGAGDTAMWSVTTAGEVIFVAGAVGPDGRVMRTADEADLETLTGSQTSNPTVIKFAADGTLAWVHQPASGNAGMYFNTVLDPSGDLWVTGYEGTSRLAPSEQTAVLRKLDADTGAVLEEVTLPFGKGCSVDVKTGRGIAWLVTDGDGRIGDMDISPSTSARVRTLGVPGYRLILLDETALTPLWDLPVFGQLTGAELSEEEEADVLFAADGRLYVSMNFSEALELRPVVDFAGRGQMAMKGQKMDGFIAVVGELPTVDVPPASKFVTKGSGVAFDVTYVGDVAPTYQWFKATAALTGKTTNTLSLTNVQLTAAGSYSVRLSNGRDVKMSAPAQLAVIDTAGKTVTVKPNATMTLTVPVSGTGLTYQWKLGANPVTNDLAGRIKGATDKTLVIKGMTAMDAGNYTCEVTSAAAATMLPSGVFTVTVNP